MDTHYFKQPRAPTSQMWRFLDFIKLVSLLESSAIFFPNIRSLEDLFEGALPLRQRPDDVKKIQRIFADMPEITDPHREVGALMEADLFSSYVSCWYSAPHESEAMWHLYSGSMGIAVVSTYQELVNAFPIDHGFDHGLVSR